MKPPTTGERIVYGNAVCNDSGALEFHRRAWVENHKTIAAIDAAIAAERERIAAFCEANPNKYGDQLAEMIRARGNA